MSLRPKGKHFTVDMYSPVAKARCDKTGFIFRYTDLVKQMEWRGNSLEWTGFMVGKPYVDEPNEQLRAIVFPPDPVPIPLPRPDRPTPVYWENQNTPWEDLQILSWESWDGTFDGVLAAPEAERLEALELGISPPETPVNANVSQIPQLTQAQILQSLENFNWSNASGTLPE
jgi:hypothetical protein